MKRHASWCLIVIFSACLVTDVVAAQTTRDRKVILARVVGFIGEPPKDPSPLTSWGLSDGGTVYKFQVLAIQVIQGDISYDNIVTAMEPYAFGKGQATFFMRGPPQLLAQFAGTPPNQKISMLGYLRLSARQFNLSSIEVVVPTPAAATPTPAPH